ncbi:MAG: molybdenum cofactor guanylyltransferase [Methanobacterium sp.]|nr:molybdenum cofactor guanylyltransferase [Methanobacterium sp.]
MKSIIILCGGRGRRMGQDKGLIQFHEKPLILHVLETAQDIVQEIIIVLRDKNQYKQYIKLIEDNNFIFKKLTIAMDLIPDKGPLIGIYTGLRLLSSDKGLILPCDSPFISSEFIGNILSFPDDYEALVPIWSDGMVEPLHAVYSKYVVEKIEKLIEEDIRDVKSLLEICKVKYVDVNSLDDTGHSFMNLNEPDDLMDNIN